MSKEKDPEENIFFKIIGSIFTGFLTYFILRNIHYFELPIKQTIGLSIFFGLLFFFFGKSMIRFIAELADWT